MFDWITDLIDGIGESITAGLLSVWNALTSTIWNVFLKWIYEVHPGRAREQIDKLEISPDRSFEVCDGFFRGWMVLHMSETTEYAME